MFLNRKVFNIVGKKEYVNKAADEIKDLIF